MVPGTGAKSQASLLADVYRVAVVPLSEHSEHTAVIGEVDSDALSCRQANLMSTANAALLATVTDRHRENPSNNSPMTNGVGEKCMKTFNVLSNHFIHLQTVISK